MANIFKIGDSVQLVQPVITGAITQKQFIGDDICYHVEYTDAAGETHDRWFKESELEAV